MIRNQELYDREYDRAAQGKARSLWSRVMGAFEDDYSRRSRSEGALAGAEARRQAAGGADVQRVDA